MALQQAVPKTVSFPTPDGGLIYADLYGHGDRAVVLAHGARFDKASWAKQAESLAAAGYLVLAIDFRGYGQSHGGAKSQTPAYDEMYLDVLAAAAYLRENGAKRVAVIGASMGGGAAAEAVKHAAPGEIDRVVLLAHAPVNEPGRVVGRKLFIVSEGDKIAAKVREQYDKAPEPKRLVILDGSAHAQFIFTTDQGPRLMTEIQQFLAEP